MDPRLEKTRRDKWLERKEGSMSIEDIVAIAIHGHTKCNEDEFCSSRNQSGDDACYCIRSIFPTLESYELYKELRLLVCGIEMWAEMINQGVIHGQNDN
jgi:hypothetical protein